MFKIQKLNMFIKLFVVILFFNLISFSGCIEEQKSDGNIEDLKLIIGLDSALYMQYPFNEFLTFQSMSIYSNIYNSLVEFNEKFGLIPSLAESWNNIDDYTWRFFLREGVKFHNGYNFSAVDVKYSIERIKEDKYNSVYLHFSIVKEINIINNYTIDIITKKPDPLFLNYLTYVYIISKDYHNKSTNSIPIGTGPYKYYKYNENQSLIFERFNEYWNEKPKYKIVTIKFYDNYEDKLNALISGDVDLIDNIKQEDVQNLSKKDGIKNVSFFTQNVYYLSFDFRKNNSCCFIEENPVSDFRIRKAIYHAINIDNIINNITSYSLEPASQFINSNIIGYNPNIKRLPYDLDKARQYMKDAGFENGFEIELDCRDISFIMNTSKIIANQLLEINITVNVNILPRNEYIPKVYINRNSSFYLTGWQVDSGDAGEIFNNILSSVNEEKGFGDFNYGYYSNNEIDTITDEINSEMDNWQRINLMHDGFEIAMDDIACIPLYIVKSNYLMKDYISFVPRADSFIKFDNVDI